MPVLLCAAVFAAGAAVAEYADFVFVPPTAKSAGLLEAARYPLPRAEALRLLAAPMPGRTYAVLDGQADPRKAQDQEGPAIHVAAGQRIDLDAALLFEGPQDAAGPRRWTARIASDGALALRLRVDLSGFAPDQALWLIDGEGGRTFGPFTAAQARERGTWLPTTLGPRVVLVLESPDTTLPPLRIEALSHFYRLFDQGREKDAALCPEPVPCEGVEAARQVSTSVGMLIIPSGLGQVQCTGTLLNRAGTPTFDPLLITAHHCFNSYVDAEDVEVLWDYRKDTCDLDPVTFTFDDLPRSRGVEMLAQSRRLDGQFLRLDQAPVGVYGRAWAGWDTRAPVAGDAVQGFHLPAGTSMKTCRGAVVRTGQTECMDVLCTTRYEMQTTVRWAEGITEGGSSGSGMFYRDLNWRLGGMLSNGTMHTCGKPENNIDDFASFGEFYPLIACHLTDGAACAPQEATGCLVSKSLGGDSAATRALRAFRDDFLAKTVWGQTLSRAYYKISPPLARD